MKTLKETKDDIEKDPENWSIYLMDFVDDFRFTKDTQVLLDPFEGNLTKWSALLASTAMYLCDELGLEAPAWLKDVPACERPWFVSGIENLKAISIAESPLHFRIRKIFVLENFLSRV